VSNITFARRYFARAKRRFANHAIASDASFDETDLNIWFYLTDTAGFLQMNPALASFLRGKDTNQGEVKQQCTPTCRPSG
jgi:hypothetical protein